MTKFKCDGCRHECSLPNDNIFTPIRCPYFPGRKASWRVIEEEKETVTDCNHLPKLTAEVFDRPDCFAWANYVAVGADGKGFYFQSEPAKTEYAWKLPDDCKRAYIGIFDASDWENSLIKRQPKEKLPDWCKVGEWVYYIPLTEYCKIEQIHEGLVLGFMDGEYTTILFKDINNLGQANQRPFNAEEMQKLVGKILDTTSSIDFIVSYDKYSEEIITYDDTYSAERLMGATLWRIDGKPCYVLEHKNDKGEWVE